MLHPSTDSKIFRADPNFSVPDQKHRYILCWLQNFSIRQKDDFRLYLVNSVFVPAQNVLVVWPKKIGLVQNILEPVEGRTRHICKTTRGLDLTLCMYIFYRPKRT